MHYDNPRRHNKTVTCIQLVQVLQRNSIMLSMYINVHSEQRFTTKQLMHMFIILDQTSFFNWERNPHHCYG